MRTLARHQLWFTLCILSGMGAFAGRTTAQEDTYGYNYHFTDNVNLWDVSGTYTHNVLGCPLDHTVSQDAAGNLTGQGTISCTVEGVTVNASFTITGTIRQSRGTARVKMTVRFKGTASDIEGTYRLRAVDRVSAEVDPATSSMSGTLRVTVVADGESASERMAYFEDLPAGMDGSSDLTVNLSRTGNRLTGTSQLQLSNGDALQFSTKGAVSVRKNVDKLTLSSPEKQKLKMSVDRATGEITVLTGKVLGQSLRAKNVPGTVTP